MPEISGGVSAIAKQLPILRRVLDSVFSGVGLSSVWKGLLSQYAMNSTALQHISRHGTHVTQVVGVPRSGTTLLATILDAHPRAVCIIEPYLSWLESGKYEYNWDQLTVTAAELYSVIVPHYLISHLCSNSELQVVGFKETFRTPGHSTFPTQPFLQENHASGAVDATIAIVRDPRDTWASVVRRHSDFRGDTEELKELIHSWNELCVWIEEEEIEYVRYEDLVSNPNIVKGIFDGMKFNIKKVENKSTSGYGDLRAQKGKKIDDSSVGKYTSTLSKKVICLIENKCKKNMRFYSYM